MLTRPALASAALGGCLSLATHSAFAVPKQIIILRHGEKKDGYALCDMGIERSQALVAQYLGKGAADSLFPSGTSPAAFFAITLHSLELASPAAASWGLPIIDYTVVPPMTKSDEETALDLRTQRAANAVLTNPAWNSQVVVMAWEHKHIADKKLNTQTPAVTLRQLLNLDQLTGANHVHETWQGDNYDYFWIVNYSGSTTPVSFTAQKQIFMGKYKDVPANDWGKKEKPKPKGCK